tara:strand:+ start:226 stop:753 length:528 start_codon:yes stop_codon:yes gene_type:complete
MVKAKKDPYKPKRGLSAFMLFSQERRPTLKKEQPTLAFGEVARTIGIEWKKLSAKKRLPLEKRSEKSRAEYKKAMETYKPPADAGKKKKKRKKDPNAPKRSKSAYMFFVSERRPKLVKEQPEFTFAEYGRALGLEWKQKEGIKGNKGKGKYDKEAALDKERYLKEMEEYTPMGNI